MAASLITQEIAELPTPPTTANPTGFDAAADAFLTAMDTFADELETFRGQANSLATQANTDATSAAASALAAAASETAAEAAADATAWSSGGTYVVGDVVYDSTTGYSYRCIQNNSGPAIAVTNVAYWTLITVSLSYQKKFLMW